MTPVVNLRDHPDLRAALEDRPEHDGTVRIDRKSRWGNSFIIGRHGSREDVIEFYRRRLWCLIEQELVSLDDLASLQGKRLACWCAPLPCHGDVLTRAAEWAARRIARMP